MHSHRTQSDLDSTSSLNPLVVETLSQEQQQLALVRNPSEDSSKFGTFDLFLARDAGLVNARDLLGQTKEGLVAEIIHASTLCSNGAIGSDGCLAKSVEHHLQRTREAGINTIYLLGMYEASVFSELLQPHFVREWRERPENISHVGPSVFSISDYVPNSYIGSWKNFRKIVRHAREKYGIRICPDFVPNTIGLDSRIARSLPGMLAEAHADGRELDHLRHLEHRGTVRHESSKETTSIDGSGRRVIQHNLKVIALGGRAEFVCYTRRDAQDRGPYKVYVVRDHEGLFKSHFWIVNNEQGGHPAIYCRSLGRDRGTGIVWCDVAQLKTWTRTVRRLQAGVLVNMGHYCDLIRADMAHFPSPGYWRDLQRKVRDVGVKKKLRIIGEAYGQGVHGRLASEGLMTYSKWVLDNLHRGDIAAVMGQIYNQNDQDFLKHNCFVFSATHDDERGPNNLVEGAIASILMAFPVPGILLAQGQRHGDTFRYGANVRLTYKEFMRRNLGARNADPRFYDHMSRVVALMGKDIFRNPESTCRPARLEVRGSKQLGKVFHTVRHLGDERTLVVVDFQAHQPNSKIVVDVAETFRVDRARLDEYALVNLVSNQVVRAEASLELLPHAGNTGFDSFMYALLPKSKVEPYLLQAKEDCSGELSDSVDSSEASAMQFLSESQVSPTSGRSKVWGRLFAPIERSLYVVKSKTHSPVSDVHFDCLPRYSQLPKEIVTDVPPDLDRDQREWRRFLIENVGFCLITEDLQPSILGRLCGRSSWLRRFIVEGERKFEYR